MKVAYIRHSGSMLRGSGSPGNQLSMVELQGDTANDRLPEVAHVTLVGRRLDLFRSITLSLPVATGALREGCSEWKKPMKVLRWLSNRSEKSEAKTAKETQIAGTLRIPAKQPHNEMPIPNPLVRPKKRGKPVEQYEREMAAYCKGMRQRFAETAARNRKRSVAMGITNYRWMVGVPEIACDIAHRNDGKIFSYLSVRPRGLRVI